MTMKCNETSYQSAFYMDPKESNSPLQPEMRQNTPIAISVMAVGWLCAKHHAQNFTCSTIFPTTILGGGCSRPRVSDEATGRWRVNSLSFPHGCQVEVELD